MTDARPVLLVTNQVPPDRVPALRALHAAEGLEVALYDGRLHHATAGVEDPGVPFTRVSQRGVHAIAASGRHRAVIATSAGRVALPAAYLGARRAGIPFLWWTGIWAPVRTPAHVAGAPLMRAIERGADGTIAYGEHVAAYARGRGARNVHVAPQAVDVAFWTRPGDGAAARAALGDPAFVALFAGRDAPGKGLDVLLEAWALSGLAAEGGVLVLAGAAADGPGVHELGPVPAAQLRDFYAAADVVVVPSVPTRRFREPWALVVNEAMHQSATVIATDAVGAAAGGLVRDGETGRVVPAGDAHALAGVLRALRADPAERARLGAAGHRAAAELTPEAWASAVSGRAGKRLRGAGGLLASRRVRPPRRAPASGPVRSPLPTVLPRALPALLLVLACLLAPAAAHASYQELLKDACRDEKVDGTYSQKDYREALANLPADTDQYTNCRAVLRAAQLAAAKNQAAGGSSTPAGSDPVSQILASGDPLATATPTEKAAVTAATQQGGAPITVAGKVVEPSSLGAGRTVAASISDLPVPLLIALAICALAAVAALLAVLIPRVRERRHD